MLILLDIDGVMVQGASWRPVEKLDDGFSRFSPRAVSSLQRILSETSNATIVLTSSHKSTYNVKEWRGIFNRRGINVTSIKRLSENKSCLTRKDEILKWFSSGKPTEDFVIIDDDKSLNDLPAYLKKKVVLTSATVGLNEEMAETAIGILKHA